MKIKCINNISNYKNITIGKTYKVTDIIDNWYYIINDINIEDCYEKELFKALSEIRNEKINKLLGL